MPTSIPLLRQSLQVHQFRKVNKMLPHLLMLASLALGTVATGTPTDPCKDIVRSAHPCMRASQWAALPARLV